MNFKRLWSIFIARNYEFFRDRTALGWNFLFPFLIVVGFGVIFGNKDKTEFKVGIFPAETEQLIIDQMNIPDDLKKARFIQYIGFANFEEGQQKLRHHKIDFLIKTGSAPYQYWISNDSPKGYIMEKVFQASIIPQELRTFAEKQEIQGINIRYVDWLFPGILGMNMMFSALFGVGYVIVLYRKNGVLKRLKATPLTALEYLAAQMLSRIFLIMFTVIIVWIGCNFVFHFRVEGSYLHLFIVFFVGGLSLTSVGLIMASRGTSEEFTSGVLNFISWPMMFLSEVWFSLEGAPHWVKTIAKIFPLTYIISAARRIMNDGAGIMDVMPDISILLIMTVICLVIGSALFSWNK